MVLLGLDEVLAQRVARPVLGHEDAAEVGMPLEDDAEEVVEPVGSHAVNVLGTEVGSAGA